MPRAAGRGAGRLRSGRRRPPIGGEPGDHPSLVADEGGPSPRSVGAPHPIARRDGHWFVGGRCARPRAAADGVLRRSRGGEPERPHGVWRASRVHGDGARPLPRTVRRVAGDGRARLCPRRGRSRRRRRHGAPRPRITAAARPAPVPPLGVAARCRAPRHVAPEGDVGPRRPLTATTQRTSEPARPPCSSVDVAALATMTVPRVPSTSISWPSTRRRVPACVSSRPAVYLVIPLSWGFAHRTSGSVPLGTGQYRPAV